MLFIDEGEEFETNGLKNPQDVSALKDNDIVTTTSGSECKLGARPLCVLEPIPIEGLEHPTWDVPTQEGAIVSKVRINKEKLPARCSKNVRLLFKLPDLVEQMLATQQFEGKEKKTIIDLHQKQEEEMSLKVGEEARVATKEEAATNAAVNTTSSNPTTDSDKQQKRLAEEEEQKKLAEDARVANSLVLCQAAGMPMDPDEEELCPPCQMGILVQDSSFTGSNMIEHMPTFQCADLGLVRMGDPLQRHNPCIQQMAPDSAVAHPCTGNKALHCLGGQW